MKQIKPCISVAEEQIHNRLNALKWCCRYQTLGELPPVITDLLQDKVSSRCKDKDRISFAKPHSSIPLAF